MVASPYCDAVSRELERMLASSLFGRSEQLSRLLRFIVDRSLQGRDGELKESVIAVEVFGRRPDYELRRDPIVRTEARRLRTRLAEYYRDEGRADSWVILLPKGGYVPVFRNAQTTTGTLVSQPSVTSVLPARPRRSNVWALLVLVALAVSLGSSAWWWLQRSAPIRIAVLPLEI